MTRNEKLQELCRYYLSRLKEAASKRGLLTWVENIINENKNGHCVATEQEVELLSRCVNDERIARQDIPTILDKSYRQCVDDEDFEKIKKLPHVGIYSKVHTLLHGFIDT